MNNLKFLSSKGIEISVCKETHKGGGEGNIHKTNIPNTVAKIYKDLPLTLQKKAKLEFMLKNPPEDPTILDGHISIAWPNDLLFNSNTGELVGFLMPEILSEYTLDCIYQEEGREEVKEEIKEKVKFDLNWNWFHLHIVACNVSAIVMALHDKGYVIGDIKCQNFLVRLGDGDGRVSIVDTDSFQIKDSKNGKIYPCLVESAEFNSPESLQREFSNLDREINPEHDEFALGVIVYQLLLGDHPFDGKWTLQEDKPDRSSSIKNGWWCYAPNSPMKVREVSISIELLHLHIQNLFKRCFVDGHQNPLLRPKAKEWHRALRSITMDKNNKQHCEKKNTHIYDIGHTFSPICPWCEIEKKHGIDYFPISNTSDQSFKDIPFDIFSSLYNDLNTQKKIDTSTFSYSKPKVKIEIPVNLNSLKVTTSKSISSSNLLPKILIPSILVLTISAVAISPLRDQIVMPIINQIGKVFKK